MFCQHLPVEKFSEGGKAGFANAKPGTTYMVADLGGIYIYGILMKTHLVILGVRQIEKNALEGGKFMKIYIVLNFQLKR